MNEQQQPECPAEYAWMKPGEIGIQILSQQFVIIQSEPAYMCREWRVTVDYPDSAFGERTRNLSINCEVLENAKSDRAEIVSDLERLRNFRLFDLAKIEAQDKELESLRARLAEAEARVKELESGIPAILESQKRTEQDVLNFTPVYNELIRQRNENLDRAIKAEARASASDAILARVKALLDGVGPVVKTVAKAIDETDDHFNASPYDSHPDKFVLTCGYGEDAIGLAYEMDADDGNFVVDLLNGGVALLSAISEVREVLQ